MGNLQADGYAEGVTEGWATLRDAIAANLQSNHLPAIPLDYLEPVMKAIEAYNEGDVDDTIDITCVKDTGVIPILSWEDDAERLFIGVVDLLQITHSWAFCPDIDE